MTSSVPARAACASRMARPRRSCAPPTWVTWASSLRRRRGAPGILSSWDVRYATEAWRQPPPTPTVALTTRTTVWRVTGSTLAAFPAARVTRKKARTATSRTRFRFWGPECTTATRPRGMRARRAEAGGSICGLRTLRRDRRSGCGSWLRITWAWRKGTAAACPTSDAAVRAATLSGRATRGRAALRERLTPAADRTPRGFSSWIKPARRSARRARSLRLARCPLRLRAAAARAATRDTFAWHSSGTRARRRQRLSRPRPTRARRENEGSGTRAGVRRLSWPACPIGRCRRAGACLAPIAFSSTERYWMRSATRGCGATLAGGRARQRATCARARLDNARMPFAETMGDGEPDVQSRTAAVERGPAAGAPPPGCWLRATAGPESRSTQLR